MTLPNFLCFMLFGSYFIIAYGNGKDDFLINTTECKIPNKTFEGEETFTQGSCGERLVFINKINDRQIRFHMKTKLHGCCYNFVYLSNGESEDFKIGHTPCVAFKNNTQVSLSKEFIFVKCKEPDYEDHYVILKKIPTNIRVHNSSKAWNVLMVGVGAMSRMRSVHSLPRTTEYLREQKFLDYRGYNKIGLNTMSNLIPLLTGKSTKWLYEDKLCEDASSCDHLLIWNAYKKAGYVTAFGEDGPLDKEENNFNTKHEYQLKLYTDHYLRPLSLMGEREDESLRCNGHLSTCNHTLNYILDFANTYRQSRFFGFFWMTLSKTSEQSPSRHDNDLLNLFKELRNSGLFENTFIIFFSDHGMRFGRAGNPIDSFYEARLPMLYINVPTLFTNYYPHRFLNLYINQYRLLSPLDLHVTLMDVLRIQGYNHVNLMPPICKSCMSIFTEVPDSRTCDEAGIDVQWCTCYTLIKPPNDDFGRGYSIDIVASFLRAYPNNLSQVYSSLCTELSISNVTRIHSFNVKGTKYYVLGVVTNPHNTTYEIYVKKFLKNDSFDYEISRWDRLSLFPSTPCLPSNKGKEALMCECVSNEYTNIFSWIEKIPTNDRIKVIVNLINNIDFDKLATSTHATPLLITTKGVGIDFDPDNIFQNETDINDITKNEISQKSKTSTENKTYTAQTDKVTTLTENTVVTVETEPNTVEMQGDTIRVQADKISMQADKIRAQTDQIREQADKAKIQTDKMEVNTEKLTQYNDIRVLFYKNKLGAAEGEQNDEYRVKSAEKRTFGRSTYLHTLRSRVPIEDREVRNKTQLEYEQISKELQEEHNKVKHYNYVDVIEMENNTL